jgi:6-phosphogluconolactonase
MGSEIKILPTNADLCRAAAREFHQLATTAVAERGRFTVALSGGNTPRSIYSLLASEHKDLPWERIHIFFGDERHVPPTDSDSNFRMANESLLSKVPIPEGNVHRVRAELDANAAAEDYAKQLSAFFQLGRGEWPRFDLVWLGLGEDGHTASLFPGSDALNDTSHLAAANWVQKFQTFRITLTFPVLNRAAEVAFLVSGESKAQILSDIMKPGPKKYPSQSIQPEEGHLLWLLDQDAAKLLRPEKLPVH